MTCAELGDRLIDFLYQELGADERQQVEAHLRGCDACRGEAAGLGRSLGRAREALRGPLAEEAPARVRAEIMNAARAALPSMSGAGARAALAGGPALAGRGRSRAETVDPEGAATSLWRWLKRPWFFPAFAAVSALALFFIARPALMKPTPTSMEEGAGLRPEEPAPPPAPEPAAPAGRDPASLEAPASPAAPGGAGAPAETRSASPASEQDRAGAGGSKQPGLARKREDRPRSFVPRPPARKAAVSAGKAPEQRPAGSAAPASPPRATAPTRPLTDSRFAAPPPPAAETAASRGEAPEPMTASARADEDLAEAGANRRARADGSGERKGRVGGIVGGSAGVVGSAAGAAPPRAAAPPDDREAASAEESQPALPMAELQRRAAEAERTGRRAEAARWLRELLRRFPGHRDAPRWKLRLEAALR